jgi:hypothetical protein
VDEWKNKIQNGTHTIEYYSATEQEDNPVICYKKCGIFFYIWEELFRSRS